MLRLRHRLGLDRNPLRRRTDKIAAYLAVVLVAVFLIGAPLVSMAAVSWVGRAAAAEQRATRSWRLVPAVVQRAAPAPAPSQLNGHTWVPARWTAPDGQARAGQIPVTVAVAAGQTVRLWVNEAGTPTGPPPNRGAVVVDAVATAAFALPLLVAECCLNWVGIANGTDQALIRNIFADPDRLARADPRPPLFAVRG